MAPLRIASIWALPESKPITWMSPVLPLSSMPWRTPMADPSFAP
jgi:hypothetical protein